MGGKTSTGIGVGEYFSEFHGMIIPWQTFRNPGVNL